MTVALAGLSIVALAWLIQLIRTWNGRGLARSFVLLYGIGVALLVVNSAQTAAGITSEAWLHLLVLLIIALMYLKIHK